MSAPPPDSVLAAFGVAAQSPVLLGGGQGTSWRAGSLVLKPADAGRAERAWQASTWPMIARDGFRLAAPLAAADGSLSVDGWCATEFVAGDHQPGRWPQIIAAGDRLHAALRDVPAPSFLDQRSGPWAAADRVAWGEAPASDFAGVRHLAELTALARPASSPSQLIHGDLTGNVLFHPLLPPAIIDFSPYWRPAAYASAIVVADALVWEGAGRELLAAVSHIDDLGQYLIRALIFRLVSDRLLRQEDPPAVPPAVTRWTAAVDLASRLTVGAQG